VAWEVVVFDPPPGHEVCDFCTAEPTYRLFACRNFMWLERAMFAHESVGAWFACEICGDFVDARNSQNERWLSSKRGTAILKTKNHTSGNYFGKFINFSKST